MIPDRTDFSSALGGPAGQRIMLWLCMEFGVFDVVADTDAQAALVRQCHRDVVLRLIEASGYNTLHFLALAVKEIEDDVDANVT